MTAEAAAVPRLRPLGIGEILDVGIKIYWRNAWTLFRIVVFVVLPAQIVVNLVQVSAAPSDATYTFNDRGTNALTFSQAETGTYFAGFLVALIVGALAGKLAQAASFRAVADAYLGERPDWKTSIAFALRRLHVVVAASILIGIAVGLGTIACFIPGIYLWAAFYVAIPVVLLEGQGPIAAMGRSRSLVDGRWWSTFGVALVGYVFASVISLVLVGLVTALFLSGTSSHSVVGFIVATASSTIASVITTPLTAAFATVLYIDLRVRKEGFDLLLLAQRMGVEPSAGAAAQSVDPLLPAAPAYPAEGEEQPPYWPPPPDWKPSGGSDAT